MDCYKERYQYIHFGLLSPKMKTDRWSCVNNKDGKLLGIVEWYGPWWQYCFFPLHSIALSKGCMEDIGDFIRQLMERRGG
jgi:hypothetical protein